MVGLLLLSLLTFETVFIHHTCATNYTKSVCTSIYHDITNEHVLHLTCPQGGLIYILHALYGRSSKRLCAFADGDTCLSNSLFSEAVVSCLGRTSCRIPAVPHPLPSCGMDSDYLEVKYTCITADPHSLFDICGGPAPRRVGGDGASSASAGQGGYGVPLVQEGHIMTTGFPSTYPAHAQCDCVITSAINAPGMRVHFELLDFRLQASPGCQHDYLELLRGQAADGQRASRERLCGGIGRRARRVVNGTWARVQLQTDGISEYRGFWLRVWALTGDNTKVPVTITCQNQGAAAFLSTVAPPSLKAGNQFVRTPSGGQSTSENRNIWLGTLPPEGGGLQSASRHSKQNAVSRNTGIIIGVCIAGVVTMVIINIVGIIFCRRNMQANRSKRTPPSSGPATNSLDSFSSLDTEYVSLNSNGASYHSGPWDSHLYTTYSKVGHLAVNNNGGQVNGSRCYDTGVIIERTPGVGQSSVKPSDYDYGMLPATYTRKSHTIGGPASPPTSRSANSSSTAASQEDAPPRSILHEDPYALLRDHMNGAVPAVALADTSVRTGRPTPLRRPARASDYADYDEIDDYEISEDSPPRRGHSCRSSRLEAPERQSGRSHSSFRASDSEQTPHYQGGPRPAGCERSQGSGCSGPECCREGLDCLPPTYSSSSSSDSSGSSSSVDSTSTPCIKSHKDAPTHHNAQPVSDLNMNIPEDSEYAASEASTTKSEYL